MKVLFVSSGNSHYGIIPFIKSQGESLRKEGVNLDFFSIKGKGLIGYFNNIVKLREYLKENNYDLIHAHYGLSGLVVLLTFINIPFVVSIMGSDIYGSFNSKGKRLFSSYLDMLLTQIVLIFAKKIIVKSKNIYNYVSYKKKCFIIPNGVDFEMFKPINNFLIKNKILFLANKKDPRKNYTLLKEAIKLVDNCDIEMINPYPIKHEEFPNYLNKASVFVLTSYNEGSPNVIKEAMACNIPIVSTDVGDVKEVIGKTEGCFISTFEPTDVAEKIKQALAFGKRTTGRKNIKHLEASVIAKRIIDVYQEVIKNK